MARHTTTVLAGFTAFLTILIPVIAADPKPKAANDDVAQLKAALEERITELTTVQKHVEAQYNMGAADLAQLIAADKELCNAQLDS